MSFSFTKFARYCLTEIFGERAEDNVSSTSFERTIEQYFLAIQKETPAHQYMTVFAVDAKRYGHDYLIDMCASDDELDNVLREYAQDGLSKYIILDLTRPFKDQWLELGCEDLDSPHALKICQPNHKAIVPIVSDKLSEKIQQAHIRGVVSAPMKAFH